MKTTLTSMTAIVFLVLGIASRGQPKNASADSSPTTSPSPIQADICIYGGTSAGVIAAIQADRLGKSVVLVEAGQHLGGMSVEGLGATDIDNHPGFQNSPAVGGLTLEFYRKISQHYHRQDQFEEMLRTGRKQRELWRFEPHVAEAVWNRWIQETNVRILRGHRLKETTGVHKKDGKILSITCENGVTISAQVFLDATYEGDLLAFAGASFAVGREGNAKYNETKNGIRTDTTHGQFSHRVDAYKIPGDPSSGVIFGVQDEPLGNHGEPHNAIQGYSFRLCLTKDPDNRLPMGRPENYDPEHFELQRRYLQAGGRIPAPISSIPNGKTDVGAWHHLAANFTGWNHSYPTASNAEREQMLQTSRQYIQGVYWFMSHDPAIPEKVRAEWAQWGLCKDEFTDNAGWPHTFYVRNGRRLVSDFVLTEAYLRKTNPLPVEDPVGLIWWPPDFHHARRLVKEGRVWNEGAVFESSKNADWIPCGIPYRALVPRREECLNLLTPTCPSSSYVAYGAYRIEFTFMIAGQSAATAAVLAIDEKIPVQDISYPALRQQLRQDAQVLEAKLQ